MEESIGEKLGVVYDEVTRRMSGEVFATLGRDVVVL